MVHFVLKKFSQYDNIHYWVIWTVDLFEIVLILILFVSGEYRGSKWGSCDDYFGLHYPVFI